MATNGISEPLQEIASEHMRYASEGMVAYRSPSLLQPHKARQAIADAHAGRIPPLIGLFCAWASPPITKVVSQLGFDFVWVEWEHTSMSVETMTQVPTPITAALSRRLPTNWR